MNIDFKYDLRDIDWNNVYAESDPKTALTAFKKYF